MIFKCFHRIPGRLRLVVVMTFWLGLFGCSNTKDTFVNRTFHNLSAHYNGYYNAGLKLKEATDNLAAADNDHYDRILSVFQYADATKAKAVYPLLDDAMKRTSTVIQRHTIVDKHGNEKPESEKWIDDNWLLYGKAQFFRHDYFEAMETFKYVEVTYRKEPTRFLASLWIAKVYIELTQLKEAEDKLDYLRNQSEFPKKSRWEFEAVNADFYVQTKNYDKAIVHLKKAVELTPNRQDRIRWMFILAQLHQEKKEYREAYDLFSKVIKMNPVYEMAFNARLNRARSYDATMGSAETVRKELFKLEADPKNKDFLDQIYYALAGLAKNEGKQEEQIDYLNKSVRSSVNNPNQKALSYLELGKIFLAKPDYVNAQVYYDSTISSLAIDYPDYTEILTIRNSLTRLVKHIRTIELEDSLQRLAKMSPAEQQKMIDDLIAAQEEAKRKEREERQVNQIFGGTSNRQEANQFNQATGSSWYFYNPQAISFGFNEFVKRFGERKLEDNWRRANKEISGPSLTETLESTDPGITGEFETDSMNTPAKRRENMLKAIPVSDTSLAKSTDRIIDAYYNIALIYREQLNDNKASAETFEELLRRFPDNRYKLQCYYQLYRLYSGMGNTAKAEEYKNIILTRHGDTEYAEIIRNPNYAAEMASRKSNLELFYEETYRKYMNGEYADVIRRKAESDIQFPENPLKPKFALLKALAIGKTKEIPVFMASLQDIVNTYPDDGVKDQAQDILDYLGKTGGVKPGDEAKTGSLADSASTDSLTTAPGDSIPSPGTDDGRLYHYYPDTAHYVILIFQNIGGPIDGDKLKNRLSDFNTKNFGTKGYTMQDFLFDHRNKIVVIRTFTNRREALDYHATLYNNDEVFGQVAPDKYEMYAVSVNNLPALIQEKKTIEYQDFYRLFYQ